MPYFALNSVAMGAAVAQWIRQRLPSCGPGFKSQAHHPHCYSQILYSICHCTEKRTKINKKRPGLASNISKFNMTDLNYKTS